MYRNLNLKRIKSSFASNWNLSAAQVEENRILFGANDILENRTNQWLELAVETIKDPMIWFLVATSFLFALLKNYNQSLILMLATIPLICMDAFLHWRTQESTRNLKNVLDVDVIAIRDDVEVKISAKEIVPSDLIKIKPGQFFPADGILIEGKNLQVDESTLTGENFPVRKKILDKLIGNSDELNIEDYYWGLAGTRVLTGEALMRVAYTGQETLYGEIITSALQSIKAKTPLQIAISKLVFNLIIIASLLCVILAVVRYFQGFGVVDAILSSATLAVAALPDEFPVVFTLFLGLGVYRLAKRNALVRRSVSVENIGRVTCICSDKTGTITEGILKLVECIPVPDFNTTELLTLAGLASRIDSGDPLDLAIHDEIQKKNLSVSKCIATFPFTEDRKRETGIAEILHNRILVSTKGSPETILSLSTLSSEDKKKWLEKVSEFGSKGNKVIGCAQYISENMDIHEEPNKSYQFVGLLIFSDPPRKEVLESVKHCISSGIHVLMITGDHPETARTIAKYIGLGQGNPKVVVADEAQKQCMNSNKNYFRTVDVIARALPSQKFFIVKNLQSHNEIVAVTGDGVNDVPALKVGDVGIAMGERGTQSARDVADIVLLDDNFSSIVNAIFEGRQLFKNLKLSFKYLLMIHMPFVISAAMIPLFGYPLVYFPIHVVWIELFIHPTAMLVFQDLPETKILEPINREVKPRFFSNKDWVNIILMGVITTAFVMVGFIFIYKKTSNIAYARSFIMAILGFLSAALTIGLSRLRTKIAQAVALGTLVLTIAPIQIPFISEMLFLQTLTLADWSVVTFFALFVMILVKI